jgi:hypothetical protein
MTTLNFSWPIEGKLARHAAPYFGMADEVNCLKY